VIDYVWAAKAAALSQQMTSAPATAQLVRNAGAAAALSSLMTNYEGGVIRVLPMKGHLALDFVLCGALIASPLFLPASERRWAIVPVLLGAAGLLVGALSQTQSPAEADAAGFSTGRALKASMKADEDLARAPHLRTHME
jgi:hypothetical protein